MEMFTAEVDENAHALQKPSVFTGRVPVQSGFRHVKLLEGDFSHSALIACVVTE